MKAYLGIDIGSISTNLVLLDETDQVIAKRYLMTAGQPIEAVKQGLGELRQELGAEIEVLGCGTTGSGRYLVCELFGADLIKNEITAQAAAAIFTDPSVDTIFEIGGQDSKYISVTDGRVIDFTMNKVCAAGTGSFLEEQAAKLGISIKEEFSTLASLAPHPSSLGDRCTVFIESELNNHLQKGSGKPELCAGLAEAIVKNYLHKVVENRPVGQNIFFQGGVAFNQAVVKAFGTITGKKITVPPHHEVTGAIGIALLAKKEKKWERSRFKGFGLSALNYQTKIFTCKSCENLCDVNMITVDDEEPLFYGGRCEKWEGRDKGTKGLIGTGGLDLFKARDEIIFSQVNRDVQSQVPKIGIPRALFFYERFPFWQAFFSALGFEVVLSSPSNQQIVHAAQENNATETCFPITLAQGHIIDLLEKKVDHIFLPSLINMEKADPQFNESFNCPFIQALPYFARAGIEFPPEVNVLSPALEPQRGRHFFQRQLVNLARELGCSRGAAIKAFHAAEKEFTRAKKALHDLGEKTLAKLAQEKRPALVIISRPYNGSDTVLNLGIPKKLQELGITAIPIDLVPINQSTIVNDHPNMYWNYGQKMLAVAAFVEQHPDLAALHITNFRCGPDSFITHLLRDTLKSKPLLQIEVDEHSSDTGIITRLEAFLDSWNPQCSTINALSSASSGSKNVERRTSNIERRKRTLYLPRMCDHTEILAAAIHASGGEAEVLPPSDQQTLELGRKHTSGKECHPFIVTTGDFIKKIKEPGFDPERSAFFMPSASGPCRFGNYHQAQKLLFKKYGYPDIPLVSPTARDAYGKSMGLDLAFRRRAWQGMVAVDLLTKLTLQKRPQEKNPGETDELHGYYLQRICQALESGNGKLKAALTDAGEAFAAIPVHPNGHKPLIGIVGEIFLRGNPESNANIIKKIEALGGQVWLAPVAEWGFYISLGFIYESFMQRKPGQLLMALGQDLVQKLDEHHLTRIFKGKIRNLREPSPLTLIRHAAPYLHYSYKGEAVLSLGKAVDYINKGASGIINILPFTCMPGTVVAALAKKLRSKHDDFPWLDLSIDGNEGVNLETRLEAFMHQAKARQADRKED